MEDVCYICTDNTSEQLLKNICNCNDRSIHLSCQKTLVEKVDKQGNCSVCKERYTNIIFNKVNSLNYKKICFFAAQLPLLIILACVSVYNIMVYMFYILYNFPNNCGNYQLDNASSIETCIIRTLYDRIQINRLLFMIIMIILLKLNITHFALYFSRYRHLPWFISKYVLKFDGTQNNQVHV
jgi:hypothetical protein